MRRAFVIGHPIGHSRSPLIHGHWLDRHGIEGSYEAIDVAPSDLPAFLAGFPARGFVGGNVTIPYKEAAFRLVASASERSRRLGAVNTLTILPDGRLHGDVTDGIGYLAALDQDLGPGWDRDIDALVLGAGGAARAVVAALVERGLPRILVANRDPARAEGLAELGPPGRIRPLALADIPRRIGAVGLLVNTTSLGMTGQPPLEIDLSPLDDGAIVSDIVYAPLETPLLAAARARGLRAVDGLGMLLHQARPGFEAWFGAKPEVTPELRARIVSDLETRS